MNKLWYKRDFTIGLFREVFDFIKSFEKEYNITVVIMPEGSCGLWDARRRQIMIPLTEDPQSMLSCFFHELGHCYCYDMHLYKRYHYDVSDTDYAVKYGLRAEKFVDTIAKKLMKVYCPGIRYTGGYSNKNNLKFWYDIYVPYLKKGEYDERFDS